MNREDAKLIAADYPTYESRKRVRAMQITSVTPDTGTREIALANADHLTITPDFPYYANVESGWYLVVYDDGHMSCCPGDAFMRGHDRIPHNEFDRDAMAWNHAAAEERREFAAKRAAYNAGQPTKKVNALKRQVVGTPTPKEPS